MGGGKWQNSHSKCVNENLSPPCEPFEARFHINAAPQDTFPYVADSVYPFRHIPDVKICGAEVFIDLFPLKRRGYGISFSRPQAIRRGHCCAPAVLQIIKIHFSCTLARRAGEACCFRQALMDEQVDELQRRQGKFPRDC